MTLRKFFNAVGKVLWKYSSLDNLLRRLHPLEILTYTMLDTVIRQLTFTIFTLNLKMMLIVGGVPWGLRPKVLGLFVYPIVMLWTLAALHSKHLSIIGKIVMVFLHLSVVVTLLMINVKLDVIRDVHWSLGDTVLWFSSIFVTLYLFSLFFRYLLRRRGMIA